MSRLQSRLEGRRPVLLVARFTHRGAILSFSGEGDELSSELGGAVKPAMAITRSPKLKESSGEINL